MLFSLATATFIVFFAELGDKTQLMCMGFVAKFGMRKVFMGAAAAALVNTAFAVLMGEGLTRVIPLSTLQLSAGAGFLGFGFWTLRQGSHGDTCPKQATRSKYPFWTVFFSFFIAEFGDKTQLVTLGLTARFDNPFLVWVGASIGLVGAQLVGIYMSGWISKRLPPRVLQIGAAIMFLTFGTVTLFQSVPARLQHPLPVFAFLTVVCLASALLLKSKPKRR